MTCLHMSCLAMTCGVKTCHDTSCGKDYMSRSVQPLCCLKRQMMVMCKDKENHNIVKTQTSQNVFKIQIFGPELRARGPSKVGPRGLAEAEMSGVSG